MQSLIRLLSLTVLMMMGVVSLSAQDAPAFGYFLAADEDGITQIWALDLEDGATQLTQATENIVTYDVGVDGTALAYQTDENTLWFQALDGSDAFIVAEPDANVLSQRFFDFLTLSPDNSTIAYASNGLVIMNVDEGEPRMLVENYQNPDDFVDRLFMLPYEFIDNETILARVGIFESIGIGVVDANTGELLEAPRYEMNNASIIGDGTEIVLFNGSQIAPFPGLQVATVDTLDTPETIADRTFGIPSLTDLMEDVLVIDLVELENGQLRLIIAWLGVINDDGTISFITGITDYDRATQTGVIVTEAAADTPLTRLNRAQLSPDGAAVAGFIPIEGDENGAENFAIYDIANATLLDLPELPTAIDAFSFGG